MAIQYKIVRLWDFTRTLAWGDEIPRVEHALNFLASKGWAVSCSPAPGVLLLFQDISVQGPRKRSATSKRSERSKRSKRRK